MIKAAIFDTETTSRDEDREIIEAAYAVIPAEEDLAGQSDRILRSYIDCIDSVNFHEFYRPSKPIQFGAMAVHHILPSDIEAHQPSSAFKLPAVEYLCGHSIDFDHEAAGRPDVKLICTYAMAQHVWQDADSYSQSALLYMLMGPTDETRECLRGAHGATIDVLNNARLLTFILNAKPEIETWAALYEFSEQSRIPLRMPITKARGELLTDIDDGLLLWCLKQDWLPGEHPYLYNGLSQEYERRENPGKQVPDDRDYCDGLDGECCLAKGHDGECDPIPF